MKILYIFCVLLMTSCQTLPQLYQAAESIADDDAIQVKISKESIQKNTDVNVTVEVKNNVGTEK